MRRLETHSGGIIDLSGFTFSNKAQNSKDMLYVMYEKVKGNV